MTNSLITAKIIADSITENKNRLTTYILQYPRFIHAEVMTHRALSKSSSSSRAVKFKKMVSMVKENPFIPVRWMKEHSGMQGSEYFEYSNVNRDNYVDPINLNFGFKVTAFHNYWLEARDAAVEKAVKMSELGLTKQLCNRMLEPYLNHTIIITGTDWENFFSLRAHPDAEIHLQELAFKMLEAYNESTPVLKQTDEWHIPFGDRFDDDRLERMASDAYDQLPENSSNNIYAHFRDVYVEDLKIKISVARVARVSYLNFEGKDDYHADLALYNRLHKSGHFSPFEHQAYAAEGDNYSGNFRGWVQYRKTLHGENRCDNRVIKK